jgi:hypothetical protein
VIIFLNFFLAPQCASECLERGRRSIIRNRSASKIVRDPTRAKIHYVELKPQHSGELLDDVIGWRPAPSVLYIVEVLNRKRLAVILLYPRGNLFLSETEILAAARNEGSKHDHHASSCSTKSLRKRYYHRQKSNWF